jgi:uncharacterized protein (TIGR03067 family)
MKWFVISLVGLIAWNPSYSEEKPATKFDPSQLIGNWKVESGIVDGKKIEQKEIGKVLTFSKDAISFRSPQGVVTSSKEGIAFTVTDTSYAIKYKLDSNKDPIGISLVGDTGFTSTVFTSTFKAEGILEISGDEMKLVYSASVEKRPTRFESAKESKVFYFVLKKAK